MQVDRVLLAEVEFPEWHPRRSDGSCPVYGYAVRHPDGVILFDTGVGNGNALIDELYRPRVVPVDEALHRIGIDERDVVAIVNSHLHFDHCGQNNFFHDSGVPIYAQAGEIEAAQVFGYTVPEWAAIPERSLRVAHGDEVLADGISLVETIGHTPGHQALMVETDDGRVILGGQCVYCTDELTARRVAADNVHDESFVEAARQSLERVVAFAPRSVLLAHDATQWPRSTDA